VNDEPVEVVEYDPEWPVAFIREASRLRAALGARVLGVEHVGSTSVPGLVARPVIDVMLTVRRLDDALDIRPDLERLGYIHLHGPRAHAMRRHFFRDSPPLHNVHVVEPSGDEWERLVLFRNWLRADLDERIRFAELKIALAAAHRDDLQAYTDAKAPFITDALAKARAARRGAS